MKETVLLYNFQDGKRLAAAKKTLILMGVRIKVVKKEDYLKPVELLVGISDEEEREWPIYEGEELAEEMLLMAGLTSRRIDMLIGGFRKNGVGRVNLKAVLTPSNQKWNSLELFEELKKEHEAFGQK